IAAAYTMAAKDLAAIEEQLTQIVSEGHAVFPHIHAHWLDAVYMPDKNEWSLENIRYYQFSSVPAEQQKGLFDSSMEIITALTQAAGRGYKADAYRAGGWSIQPFC